MPPDLPRMPVVKDNFLSGPEGRLHIGWHVTENENGTNQRLNIDWRESRVSIPDPNSAIQNSRHRRELIERALPYQLNARTGFEMGSTCVHCGSEMPLSGAFRAE